MKFLAAWLLADFRKRCRSRSITPAALPIPFGAEAAPDGCSSDPEAAREFLRQRFHHGESTLFLALLDGVAVSFCQLYPSVSSVSLARAFTLNDLYVEPAPPSPVTLTTTLRRRQSDGLPGSDQGFLHLPAWGCAPVDGGAQVMGQIEEHRPGLQGERL